MSKPSWDDVPSWAYWIARDKDGQWRAFENKPSPDEAVGFHRPNMGRHEVVKPWAESSESRP